MGVSYQDNDDDEDRQAFIARILFLLLLFFGLVSVLFCFVFFCCLLMLCRYEGAVGQIVRALTIRRGSRSDGNQVPTRGPPSRPLF